MVDDLTKLWGNFSLLEEECLEVDIDDQSLVGIVSRGKSCLVGKLVADRFVGKEIIRSTLVRGWRPTGSTSFTMLGDNLFLVEFEYDWDKVRVLEGRPWVFDGNLFSVEEFDGVTPPTTIPFEKAAFWVRMFNLPLACMGTAVGHQIGSTMGVVEEVETDMDGIGWGSYLRVRITLDLTRPLSRGRILKLLGKSVLVAFKYEQLPHICFH